MWGQKWGELVWGNTQVLPAFGPWMVLVLGCLLGVTGVLALRSPKKTALFVSALILLVPLGALANFPHAKFADGTIAHGYEVSDDLKELVPRIGAVATTTALPVNFALGTSANIFGSSPVVAPSFSDLQCTVTANLVFRAGPSDTSVYWRLAMNIGGAVTLEPTPLDLIGNPLPFAKTLAPDTYYRATSAATFTIPAGQSASFGAQLTNTGASITTPAASAMGVYHCTITPPPWTSGP
jgi:hypothetical protein